MTSETECFWCGGIGTVLTNGPPPMLRCEDCLGTGFAHVRATLLVICSSGVHGESVRLRASGAEGAVDAIAVVLDAMLEGRDASKFLAQLGEPIRRDHARAFKTMSDVSGLRLALDK